MPHCAVCNLVERLIASCPRDVSAKGGGAPRPHPLHAAFAKGYFVIALGMFESGADVNILGRQQEQNTSPSHRESRHGHRDLVEFVLEHHIDVHIQKRKGEIPLDGAPRNEEPKPAQISLRYGVT